MGYFYATRIPHPFSRLFVYIYIFLYHLILQIHLPRRQSGEGISMVPSIEVHSKHGCIYRLDVYREWFMQPRVVKLIWICLQRIIIVFSCTRDNTPRGVLRETPFDNLSRGERIVFLKEF